MRFLVVEREQAPCAARAGQDGVLVEVMRLVTSVVAVDLPVGRPV